ncbi:fibropellin-3-like [Anneissia japonica]|uniref:fibropellin-3-like n=1 Tax=Anneissia japonica TaxID=1529436 RepID=UPI001425962E|nr:fibropellin-3-like [Anneissia japonica]
MCECPNGFTGDNCETSTDCSDNVTSIQLTPEEEKKTTGEYVCEDGTCLNDTHVCIECGPGFHFCRCYDVFVGINCTQNAYYCQNIQYLNGSSVNDTMPFTFSNGFKGISCKQSVYDCDYMECLNNTFCTSSSSTFPSSRCHCPDGISASGSYCDLSKYILLFYIISNNCSNNYASWRITPMSSHGPKPKGAPSVPGS